MIDRGHGVATWKWRPFRIIFGLLKLYLFDTKPPPENLIGRDWVAYRQLTLTRLQRDLVDALSGPVATVAARKSAELQLHCRHEWRVTSTNPVGHPVGTCLACGLTRVEVG